MKKDQIEALTETMQNITEILDSDICDKVNALEHASKEFKKWHSVSNLLWHISLRLKEIKQELNTD